jgi:hypothetical protein
MNGGPHPSSAVTDSLVVFGTVSIAVNRRFEN